MTTTNRRAGSIRSIAGAAVLASTLLLAVNVPKAEADVGISIGIPLPGIAFYAPAPPVYYSAPAYYPPAYYGPRYYGPSYGSVYYRGGYGYGGGYYGGGHGYRGGGYGPRWGGRGHHGGHRHGRGCNHR